MKKILSVAEKTEAIMAGAMVCGFVYILVARKIVKDIRSIRNDKGRQSYSRKTYRGIGGQHSVDPW